MRTAPCRNASVRFIPSLNLLRCSKEDEKEPYQTAIDTHLSRSSNRPVTFTIGSSKP